MTVIYPGVLYPLSDEAGGYQVVFPDLDALVVRGKNLEDVMRRGTDVASGWIIHRIQAGQKIPEATRYQDVRHEQEGIVNLFALDLDAYAEKYGEKSVRKNLTIPAWLNTFAEKNHVNFSQVLQDALFHMSQTL